MGCNNFQTEQTDKLVEASIRGENSGFSQETLESVRAEMEALDKAGERWDRIESLTNEYSGIEIKDVLEPETACG